MPTWSGRGLLKIKERANLYNIVEDPERLEIAEGKLFKHYFRFPARGDGRTLLWWNPTVLRRGNWWVTVRT